ncbi:MAG TPA: hypothetical protein ENO09_10050, partial [bacterium]|nr:hypothetical protein [bacterium]
MAYARTWLSYFGLPRLVLADGSSVPLQLRYRKSHALLAFVAAHPDRSVSRLSLMELLWPESESDAARGSLRVLLNDLRKQASALNEALVIDRDWVSFNSHAGVLTDRALLDALLTAPSSDLEAFRSNLMPLRDSVWLQLDIQAGSDFAAWLDAERRTLDYLQRRLWDQQAFDQYGAHFPHLQCNEPPNLLSATFQTVILLRVQFDVLPLESAALVALYAWRDTVMSTDVAVTAFGGQRVSMDDAGVTYLFGDSAQGGVRYQSLRAARALMDVLTVRLHMSTVPRMGICAGRALLANTHDTLAVHGHLPTLVERLAWTAEPGCISVEAGFDDVLSFSETYCRQTRIFRGFSKSVDYFVLPASALGADVLPAMAGSDVPLASRERELAQLARPLLGYRVTHVNGPSGVGKSRLVWEHARREMNAGRRVHWLAARSECVNTPWAVLYEWCTRVLNAYQGRTEPAAGEYGEFERALSLFNAQQLVPMMERAALRDIILRVWHGATIVIDDVQWLDKVTTDFFQYMLATQPNIHLIVICRSTHEPALDLTGCLYLAVQPLDDEAMLSLIASRHPELSVRERRAAMLRSHGLPIYGLISTLESSSASDNTDLRTTIAHFVRHHAEGLGAAALLGEHFSMDHLVAMVGEPTASAAVNATSSAGLLISIDRRRHWQFLHAVFRDEILTCLTQAKTQQLAAKMGRVLVELGLFIQAAALFETGGEIESARLCWWRGGQLACVGEDYAAACEYFAHFGRMDYPSGLEGLWARIFHARAQVVQAGYGSPAVGRLALDVLEALDAAPIPDDELIFSVHSLLYLQIGGESRRAGVEQAGKMAALAVTPQQRFAADWAHGNTLFFLGRLDAAEPFIERVMDTYPTLDVSQRTCYLPTDPFVFAAVEHAWLAWFLGSDVWRERLDALLGDVI